MKWLAMIVSFILGQLKSSTISPSLIFIQKALEKSRGLMFLATVSFISALLFAAGVVIAAVNGFAQYDQSNSVYMSATLIGGITIAVLAAISLGVVFAKKNWQVPDLQTFEAESKVPSPIEEAVSMLISDFVTARRTDREHRSSHSSPYSHGSAANPEANSERPQHKQDRYAPDHLKSQIHS